MKSLALDQIIFFNYYVNFKQFFPLIYLTKITIIKPLVKLISQLFTKMTLELNDTEENDFHVILIL